MDRKLLNVSPDNFIPRHRVVAILYVDSNKFKSLVSSKREEGLLIDATRGKKTRSGVLLDNGTLILSNINGSTIAKNYEME